MEIVIEIDELAKTSLSMMKDSQVEKLIKSALAEIAVRKKKEALEEIQDFFKNIAVLTPCDNSTGIKRIIIRTPDIE